MCQACASPRIRLLPLPLATRRFSYIGQRYRLRCMCAKVVVLTTGAGSIDERANAAIGGRAVSAIESHRVSCRATLCGITSPHSFAGSSQFSVFVQDFGNPFFSITFFFFSFFSHTQVRLTFITNNLSHKLLNRKQYLTLFKPILNFAN